MATRMTLKKVTKHTCVYEIPDANAADGAPAQTVYIAKIWLSDKRPRTTASGVSVLGWPTAIDLTVSVPADAEGRLA